MQRSIVLRAPIASPASAEAGRRTSTVPLLIVCGLVVVAGVVFGSPALWVLAALGFAAVVLVQPRLGLYAIVVAAGLEYVAFDPVTSPFRFLFASAGSTASVPSMNATPVELLIAWTTIAWLIRGSAPGVRLWPNRYLLGGSIGLALAMLLALQYGVDNGGDLTIALWEMRGFLVVPPLMLLVSGLITERRHLDELAVVLFATLVFATGESLYRYLEYVRPGDFTGAIEFAFSHENGVLIALLLVVGTSWALWGTDKKQRLIALAAAILAAIVLLTIRRRAGLLLGETGLLLIGMVLLVQNWRRFILLAPIFAVGAALYLNVYWNDPNSLGQPARVFRSVFQEEETSLRDQASDDYRTRERINVWWNIQARPLEGTGFGVAYDKPLPFPDLTSFWPFWPYIPHNTILWLWMKAGLLGFLLFWYVMGTGLTQTAQVVRRTKDPWLLTAGVVTMSFLIMLAMFSYIDLGLTSPRLMILFGVFLGLVTVLQRFLHVEETERDELAAEAAPA